MSIGQTVGPKTLGEVIKARRLELRLTQEELAHRISETERQADVSKLELGRVQLPRAERLAQYARALGLSLGELLARSGWTDAEEFPALNASSEDAKPEAELRRELHRLADDLDWRKLYQAYTALLGLHHLPREHFSGHGVIPSPTSLE